MKRRRVFVELLEACNNGKSQIPNSGLLNDGFLATKRSSGYGNLASTEHARQVFDKTGYRAVYLWNSTLKSYCRGKHWKEILYIFNQMVRNGATQGANPDNLTISILLKACAGLCDLRLGRMVHGFVRKNDRFNLDMGVGCTLIELYYKCGQLGDALKVFKEFPQPDVVLWTSMVTGYEVNGYPEKAVAFFCEMVVKEQVSPDPITLVSLVSACARLLNVRYGKCVHGFVIRKGFDDVISLVNSLLNLYAKAGALKVASYLFRNMKEKCVISWSTMIVCYTHNGVPIEALGIFNEMIDKGYEPSAVTVASALRACADACDLEEGKRIHQLAVQKGFESDASVSTHLIDMYMNCSLPNEAVDVFRKMPKKDVISWAALFGGYALNGMAHKSMGTFCDMLWHGTRPDAIAMVKILSSCSELGILKQAVCLHGYVIKNGFDNNIFIGASLVELYSKCGSLDNASKVFNRLMDKDVVIWSAMIAAYGIHGQGREALKIFDQMVKNPAVRPNNVTFLSVLSACSHAGLIAEGIEIFNMMMHEYRLNPKSEHYGIMVDLLGRTGEIEKAMNIIKQMPIPAGSHVWGALLGACRIHHNIDMGEVVAKNLFDLDSSHAGYYALLSNIYALDGKWSDVAKIKTHVKERGLKKTSGQSMVEVRSEVHSFVADDKYHPQCEQIYELLRELEVKMRKKEYAASDVELQIHGVETVI